MTETEAKGKWCPMVQEHNYFGRILEDVAGGKQPVGQYHCIGSACMMWRWDSATTESRCNSFALDGKPEPPDGEGWALQGEPRRIEVYDCKIKASVDKFIAFWKRDVAGFGHCGLAGRP